MLAGRTLIHKYSMAYTYIVLRRLRQEDYKFEASLSFHAAVP